MKSQIKNSKKMIISMFKETNRQLNETRKVMTDMNKEFNKDTNTNEKPISDSGERGWRFKCNKFCGKYHR